MVGQPNNVFENGFAPLFYDDAKDPVSNHHVLAYHVISLSVMNSNITFILLNKA